MVKSIEDYCSWPKLYHGPTVCACYREDYVTLTMNMVYCDSSQLLLQSYYVVCKKTAENKLHANSYHAVFSRFIYE